jgi:hypothetical protein
VLEAAADRLAAAGAKITDTVFPPECAGADETQRVLGGFEGLRNRMSELYRHEALLSPGLREHKIEVGRGLSLEQFRGACRTAERARAAARAWAGGFDPIPVPAGAGVGNF